MRYFSMFTGIGGFELGIERAYNNNAQIEKGKVQTENGKLLPNISVKDGRGGEQCSMFECIGYSEIDKYAIANEVKNE